MSETAADPFEAYGAIASLGVSSTLQAGRYRFQEAAERHILKDVIRKLQPLPEHRMLDIGCGSGALLIPMSFLVAQVTGLDHPATIARLAAKFSAENVELVGGRFPETRLGDSFERIVAYSVLHYLADQEAVKQFALAAAGKLSSGGRLMLGDIPNKDRQNRYRLSEAGKAGELQWARLKAQQAGDEDQAAVELKLRDAHQIGAFTDADLLALIQFLRSSGFEAYLMPQPRDLPFGETREDIIVERR